MIKETTISKKKKLVFEPIFFFFTLCEKKKTNKKPWLRKPLFCDYFCLQNLSGKKPSKKTLLGKKHRQKDFLKKF